MSEYSSVRTSDQQMKLSKYISAEFGHGLSLFVVRRPAQKQVSMKSISIKLHD